MLRHPKLLSLLLAGFLAAQPASAQSLAEDIALQMTRLGFVSVTIDGTWLGRVRVTGTRNGTSREIILNPNTGEILRDLWLDENGQMTAADITLSVKEAVTDAVRDRVQDRVETNVDAREDAQDDRQDARDDRQDARDDSTDN